MSTRFVLYRSRQDFESKSAIGVFSQESLKDYFRQNPADERHLVLEDGFFGKLLPIGKVGFLSGITSSVADAQQAPALGCAPRDSEIPSSAKRQPASINLLASDARKKISTRVQELSALIAQSTGISRDVAASQDPELHREFDRLQREFPISAMQEDFNQLLGILGRHEVWAESETSPIHWNMRGKEAYFFDKPIGGLVFIYKNRFYAVEGTPTVEDARAALIAYEQN